MRKAALDCKCSVGVISLVDTFLCSFYFHFKSLFKLYTFCKSFVLVFKGKHYFATLCLCSVYFKIRGLFQFQLDEN